MNRKGEVDAAVIVVVVVLVIALLGGGFAFWWLNPSPVVVTPVSPTASSSASSPSSVSTNTEAAVVFIDPEILAEKLDQIILDETSSQFAWAEEKKTQVLSLVFAINEERQSLWAQGVVNGSGMLYRNTPSYLELKEVCSEEELELLNALFEPQGLEEVEAEGVEKAENLPEAQ